MTLNAAVKLGLEGIRIANAEELNRDAVEIAIVNGDGYKILSREEINSHIDKLKPLED